MVIVIKMDDATLALFRKSLEGVFDKHFPVFAQSLLLQCQLIFVLSAILNKLHQ